MFRKIAFPFIAVVLLVAGPAFADDRTECLDGRGQAGVDACTRAIKSGRWSGAALSFAYTNRGHCYVDIKEHDRAIADYSEAIRLDPKDSDAWGGRGFTYTELGELDRAIADLNESNRLSPNSNTYNSIARIHIKKEEYDLALTQLGQALRMNSQNQHALSNRAYIDEVRGNLQRALTGYEEALRIDPALAHAKQGKESVLKKLGR